MSEPDPADEARKLLRSVDAGVLATQSVALPGYPFGSVTPFVLGPDGRVAIFISAIAQHTANIRADSKVSLTVRQERAPEGGAVADAQAVGRVTVVGDAHRVPDDEAEETAERYFLFFPDSRGHFRVHDFAFYAIEPVRVRYIGGFGAIHWIEPDAWRLPAPKWEMGARRMVDHMNDDHADALVAMCGAFRGDPNESAEMITVDSAGFHVRTPSAVHYLSFEKRCATSDDVRKEMVRLTRAARAATAQPSSEKPS